MQMPQAKLIKEKRLEMGMTMKQLGQKVGVATATVSRRYLVINPRTLYT